MTFLLADIQAAIRARTERAFQHLQRLIVVDGATREQWKEAIKIGELACEKRGAVHLLWHGIWAFKVSGAGERTDLVLQQPAEKLLVDKIKRKSPMHCIKGQQGSSSFLKKRTKKLLSMRTASARPRAMK